MEHQTNAAQAADRLDQLFSVRLWYVRNERGRIEVRGRAQQVLSGETHHFCTWQALQTFLSMEMDYVETLPAQHTELGTQ